MKIRQFEALRLVISRGTTKEASLFMGLTQSAVSRLITQLESEVGFKIFDRRQGRLHLTPEGQYFYTEVNKILQGLDQLKLMANDISTLSVGTLRLIAMPALGFGLLPIAIEQIQSRYKQLKISVDLASRETVEDEILKARHDIGLVTLPIENESLEVEPLCGIDSVCVLPFNHPLAERPVIRAEDLRDEAFISIEPGTLFRYRTDELFGKLGIKRKLRLEAQSTIMVCNLVAQNLGISLVHRFIANAFENRIAIKPFEPTITMEYGLVFPTGQPKSRTVQEFVDMLRTSARLHEGAKSVHAQPVPVPTA